MTSISSATDTSDSHSKSGRWVLWIPSALVILLLIATIPFVRAKAKWGYGPLDTIQWIIADMPDSEFPDGYTEEQFDRVEVGMTVEEVRAIFDLDAREAAPSHEMLPRHYPGWGGGARVFSVNPFPSGDAWMLSWDHVDVSPSGVAWHWRQISFDGKGHVSGKQRTYAGTD